MTTEELESEGEASTEGDAPSKRVPTQHRENTEVSSTKKILLILGSIGGVLLIYGQFTLESTYLVDSLARWGSVIGVLVLTGIKIIRNERIVWWQNYIAGLIAGTVVGGYPYTYSDQATIFAAAMGGSLLASLFFACIPSLIFLGRGTPREHSINDRLNAKGIVLTLIITLGLIGSYYGYRERALLQEWLASAQQGGSVEFSSGEATGWGEIVDNPEDQKEYWELKTETDAALSDREQLLIMECFVTRECSEEQERLVKTSLTLGGYDSEGVWGWLQSLDEAEHQAFTKRILFLTCRRMADAGVLSQYPDMSEACSTVR